MAVEELGALTNISDIGADGVYRFPVYQTQTNLPNLSQQQLQSLYGSSQMPVFPWISKIQTGKEHMIMQQKVSFLKNMKTYIMQVKSLRDLKVQEI